MRSTQPIGGFFELEIPRPTNPFRKDAIALATGRSCLQAILKYQQPARCFVPHYTCNATLAPFLELGIELVFYELDSSLCPQKTPRLNDGELFLLTNYWGLQRALAASLSRRYRDRLVVDDTHDFFSSGHYPESWSFTSARKYFGIPDGAFLQPPIHVRPADVVPEDTETFQAISLQHLMNRKRGLQSQAFHEYQDYEKSLPTSLCRMSNYSRLMLSLIDMKSAKRKRQQNFAMLAESLNESNRITLSPAADSSPFVYPYLPQEPIAKRLFHEERIFVPTLWPDVIQRDSLTCSVALDYAHNLIPLPVDHRYGAAEMNRMIDVTKKLQIGEECIS
jgi:hypothetical protein